MTTLKVSEAYTRDINRKVIRIDYLAMDRLGVSTGDIVAIAGKKDTVAKVLPLYRTDEGKGRARLDGIERRNARVSIGDEVTLAKIKPLQTAELVDIKYIGEAQEPPIDLPYYADVLETLPMMTGDEFAIPYFGQRLLYEVVGITPSPSGLISHQHTVFRPASALKVIHYTEYKYAQTAEEVTELSKRGWNVIAWIPAKYDVIAVMSRQAEDSEKKNEQV